MKKKIYTVLTIILCLLVVFYGYEWTIINYQNWFSESDQTADYLYLINTVYSLLLLWAAIGGYFLSKIWWKIVYIDKRHWSYSVKKMGK